MSECRGEKAWCRRIRRAYHKVHKNVVQRKGVNGGAGDTRAELSLASEKPKRSFVIAQ